jgi:uncharacterized protein YodC (DUF2158 family)
MFHHLNLFIAMAIKRFKPGDRVRHYGGGPVMQVMHYLPAKRNLVGSLLSGYWVRCNWYSGGKQHSQVFNQDVLIKLQGKEIGYDHLPPYLGGQSVSRWL